MTRSLPSPAALARTFILCAVTLQSAAAAGAQAQWTLTEAWRVGGAADGPASFTQVKGLAIDTRGRVFVLERSTQDIRVFDAEGKFSRVIGRKGSGPGEFRDAEGIAFAPNGKLWVRDAANARFAIFGADGTFERTWTMTFCSSQGAWTPRMDDAQRFIDRDCMVSGGRSVRDAILAYHLDRPKVDTLADMPECGTRAQYEAGTWITRTERSTSYRQIPFAPRPQAALGRSAVLWCAPNSARFEITGVSVLTPDTVRITSRLASVPVTRAEKDSIIASFPAAIQPTLDFSRIPAVKPAIDALSVDDEGRLWVRSTTAARAIEFRVFDPKGTHLATAVLGRYASPTWLPLVVRGRSLYMVVLDDDDVQHVARFRIDQQRTRQ